MDNTANLNIRSAGTQDIGVLTEFALAMALETEHKQLDHATVTRGISRVLAEPARGSYRVAERGGAVIGALMITYEWSDWRCADWWWVQSVYVSPQARRSGVFSALYRSVQGEAEQRDDVCGIRLYVERDNQGAQATYAALGMHDAAYLMMEQYMPWLGELIKGK